MKKLTAMAGVFIHSHFETEKPISIEVFEWNGSREL